MAKTRNPKQTLKAKQSHNNAHKQEKPHSWAAMKSLFTCKYLQVQQQQQNVQQKQGSVQHEDQEELRKQKKLELKQKQKLKKDQEEFEKLRNEELKQKQKLKRLQEELAFQKQNKQKQKLKETETTEQQEQNQQQEEIQKQKKQKQKLHTEQEDEIINQNYQKQGKTEQGISQNNKKQGKTEQNISQNYQKRGKTEQSITHNNKKQGKTEQINLDELNKKSKKMKCSGSLCSNTKVMQRPENSSSPEGQKKRAFLATTSSNENSGIVISNSLSSSSSSSLAVPSASPSISGSLRNIRKLSGCYECRMVVDPVLGMTRDPSLRNSICSCSECGEIFMKAENLEAHQAVRHAVSELGPEDTSKNIVEIIFQSSWLKKQKPVCKIDRILKVQNTPKTISKFEEYRDTIKIKATRLSKKHPRCLADGNELLRFHCTTLMCSLGLNGSSNLCNSIPNCSVCSIIRHGFKVNSDISAGGILTTATSGKAHDNARVALDDGKRAMLVCRVIAGRVKKNSEGSLEDYDSVAGVAGVYSNLDELYVFNPKAILPCFVVIYRGF